jgi:hypothetical protein
MEHAVLRDLSSTLERQIAILTEVSDAETELQRSVVDRAWPAVESAIALLGELADRFQSLERERAEQFGRLAEDLGQRDHASFSAVLTALPPEERKSLADQHRRLKVALFRVRTLGQGVDAFIGALATTTRGILEELYPTRKGKLYGRSGRVSDPEDWALVVNRSL